MLPRIPSSASPRRLPELYAPLRIDPVANRDDGVQIVVFQGATDLAFAFGLNYREILGSCRFLQLAVCKNILQMEANIVA